MAVVGIGEGRASVKERGGGDLQRSNGGKGKLKRRASGEMRGGESGGVGGPKSGPSRQTSQFNIFQFLFSF